MLFADDLVITEDTEDRCNNFLVRRDAARERLKCTELNSSVVKEVEEGSRNNEYHPFSTADRNG